MRLRMITDSMSKLFSYGYQQLKNPAGKEVIKSGAIGAIAMPVFAQTSNHLLSFSVPSIACSILTQPSFDDTEMHSFYNPSHNFYSESKAVENLIAGAFVGCAAAIARLGLTRYPYFKKEKDAAVVTAGLASPIALVAGKIALDTLQQLNFDAVTGSNLLGLTLISAVCGSSLFPVAYLCAKRVIIKKDHKLPVTVE